MISVSVQLDKLSKDDFCRSEKTGKLYLTLLLLDHPDQQGHLPVVQAVNRAEYQAGRRGEQVGRWKQVARNPANARP
jgi:hypothetical protein